MYKNQVMPVVRLLALFSVLLALALLLTRRVPSKDVAQFILRGTVITPTTVIRDSTVTIIGDKIGAVRTSGDAPNGTAPIETDSFIFPGLIDLHNHLTWNLFPHWPPAGWKPADWDPNRKFGTRYDWQQLRSYKEDLETPHRVLINERWGCEMNRYAEVKALAGGATSSVGSLGPERCIAGLVRDLDFYSGIYQPNDFNSEKLVSNVFPFEMPISEADKMRSRLSSGQVSAFIVHVAEGAVDNASAAREYKMLVAHGFLRPGVSIVHGVALKTPQFREMAAHGVGLIWSPKSNFELYGSTADVASAKSAGVIMAIAPDWSISGSSGMLEELKYAEAWNDRQNPRVFEDAELVRMATIYPAQLAGLSDKIGSLSSGHLADLLLLKRKGTEPYAALLHATPLDVRLVIVGGKPIYGDRDLMEKFFPADALQSVLLCHNDSGKVLYLDNEAFQGGLGKTWRETTGKLAEALHQWKISLAGLAEESECAA